MALKASDTAGDIEEIERDVVKDLKSWAQQSMGAKAVDWSQVDKEQLKMLELDEDSARMALLIQKRWRARKARYYVAALRQESKCATFMAELRAGQSHICSCDCRACAQGDSSAKLKSKVQKLMFADCASVLFGGGAHQSGPKLRVYDTGENWNQRFQEAMALPETDNYEKLLKLMMLSSIDRDFTAAAATYGKTIISEYFLHSKDKSIHPRKLGGVAGGEKYLWRGILFKLADGQTGPWNGSDEAAAKAAGHDLRGSVTYAEAAQEAGVPLHFPLMALLDYKGFRMTAQAFLPLRQGSPSLVLGSSDAGATVCDDEPQLREHMCSVAELLRLREHRCGREKTALPMACDIEGHVGADGRYYVLDMARFMPPEHPAPYPGRGVSHLGDFISDGAEVSVRLSKADGTTQDVLGKVARAHRGDQSYDVVLDDGSLMRRVPRSAIEDCRLSIFWRLLRPEFVRKRGEGVGLGLKAKASPAPKSGDDAPPAAAPRMKSQESYDGYEAFADADAYGGRGKQSEDVIQRETVKVDDLGAAPSDDGGGYGAFAKEEEVAELTSPVPTPVSADGDGYGAFGEVEPQETKGADADGDGYGAFEEEEPETTQEASVSGNGYGAFGEEEKAQDASADGDGYGAFGEEEEEEKAQETPAPAAEALPETTPPPAGAGLPPTPPQPQEEEPVPPTPPQPQDEEPQPQKEESKAEPTPGPEKGPKAAVGRGRPHRHASSIGSYTAFLHDDKAAALGASQGPAPASKSEETKSEDAAPAEPREPSPNPEPEEPEEGYGTFDADEPDPNPSADASPNPNPNPNPEHTPEPKALNPDALTAFGRHDEDVFEHNRDVKEATLFLFRDVIPALATSLCAKYKTASAVRKMNVSLEMHKCGVNMRHLGLLRAHIPLDAEANHVQIRQILLREIVGRTLKQLLRDYMRRWMRSERSSSELGLIMVVVNFLNLTTGSHLNRNLFWSDRVVTGIGQRFGLKSLTPAERRDLLGACAHPEILKNLVSNLCERCGIVLSPVVEKQFFADATPYGFEFTVADIMTLEGRIKYQGVTEFSDGEMLTLLAEQKRLRAQAAAASGEGAGPPAPPDVRVVKRLHKLACKSFESALQKIPTPIMESRLEASKQLSTRSLNSEEDEVEEEPPKPQSVSLLTKLTSSFTWRSSYSSSDQATPPPAGSR